MDVADRLIELAEDRLKAAEQLGLSVSGLVAHIYTAVAADDFDDAAERLEKIDELINKARAAATEG